jgi:hypothetical protein
LTTYGSIAVTGGRSKDTPSNLRGMTDDSRFARRCASRSGRQRQGCVVRASASTTNPDPSQMP